MERKGLKTRQKHSKLHLLITFYTFLVRHPKKLRKNQLLEPRDAIEAVTSDPRKGTQKKGLLSDMYVFTFHMNKQEALLAYKVESDALILYAIGSHENFYRDLERILYSLSIVR